MKLELSDMLANAKADPPPLRYSVEDAVAAGRKRQRRLRAAWTGAGSAAVVVAVAAAVAAPQIISDRGRVAPAPAAPAASPATSAPPSRPRFEYPADEFTGNIAGFTAGKLTVSDAVHVTPGYQVAVVVAPGRGSTIADVGGTVHQMPNDVGRLVVYRKGVFEPAATIKSSEQVSINGTPGYYRTPVPEADSTNTSAFAGPTDATLAWEYADDSWAVVSTNATAKITKQQLTAVAEKLTSGAPEPVKIGFSLGYVPAGFRLAAAGTSDNMLLSPLDGESYVRLLKGDFPNQNLTGPAEDPLVVKNKQLPIIQLAVYPRWYGKFVSVRGKPRIEVFCTEESLCYRVTADGQYDLQVNGGGLPNTELQKMLKMITFADPTDAGTWFTATDAVG